MRKKQNISKKAFTLAEALVMLTLVGFGAAMMIPIVNLGNKKNSLKEAWKKDFIAIVQTYTDVKKATEGNYEYLKDESNNQNATTSPTDEINTGLDVAKFCGDSIYVCGVTPQVLIGKGEKNIYKTLANGFLDEDDLSENQFLLTDGANVYTRNDGRATNLWVDVNGYIKGPNRLGRDLFGVVIIGNKIIPMGTNGSQLNKTGSSACDASDKYIPIGSSGKASDYAGASCSMTVLLEE